ncbi:hypothetical protein JW948_01695 [bacterium]|nr:hypothetical protein [bacterium]
MVTLKENLGHERAMEILIGKILNRKTGKQALNQAKTHIASCVHCMSELEMLMHMLGDRPASIRSVLKTFEDLSGHRHLASPDDAEADLESSHDQETCDFCQAFLQLFHEIQEDGRKGEFGRFSSDPSFSDHPELVSGRIWQDLSANVRQLAVQVKMIIEKGRAIRLELPDPGLALAGLSPLPAMRGEGGETGGSPGSNRFEFADAEQSTAITVDLIEKKSLAVRIRHLKNPEDRSPVTVSVRESRNNKLLYFKNSVRNSAVIFDISRRMFNNYLLNIKVGDMTWQIPIVCEEMRSQHG